MKNWMKTLCGVLTTGLAAIFVAACADSESIVDTKPAAGNSSENAIVFDTYLSNAQASRAATAGGSTGVITTESLKTGANNEGFGVFAYLTDGSGYAGGTAPNFMYNQQVSWSSTLSAWEYSPVKYWPNATDAGNTSGTPSNTAASTADSEQKLSFFAYAPYVSTVGTSSGIKALPANNVATRPVIEYVLAANPTPTNVVDLLWGTRGQESYQEADGTPNVGTVGTGYNVDLTKQTATEKIQFLFKHALAKVGGSSGLKVVYDLDGNGVGGTGFGKTDDNTLVTLKNVTIKDAIVGEEGSKKTTIIPSGKFDISQGTWSDWGTPSATTSGLSVSVDYKTSNALAEAIAEGYRNGDDKAPTYSTDTKKWGITGVTTTPQDVCGSANADPVFLIPGKAGQILEVEVEYVVRTYDSKLTNNGEGTWTKVTQKIKNNVTLPALEVNKSYTLVIHLGLTSVKFSADVASWDAATGDGSDNEVWLPSNVISETTSTEVAKQNNVTVAAAAEATSYTINMTGLTAGNTVAVSGTGKYSSATVAYTSSGAAVQDDGKATVTVTLTANTSTTERASSVITLTEKDGEDAEVSTTIVKIVQSKAAVTS